MHDDDDYYVCGSYSIHLKISRPFQFLMFCLASKKEYVKKKKGSKKN